MMGKARGTLRTFPDPDRLILTAGLSEVNVYGDESAMPRQHARVSLTRHFIELFQSSNSPVRLHEDP